MPGYNPIILDVGVDRGKGKTSGNTRGFSASSHWPYQPGKDIDEDQIDDDLDFFLGKDDEVLDKLLNKVYGQIAGDSHKHDQSAFNSAEFAGMRESELREFIRETLVHISGRIAQDPPVKNAFGETVPEPKVLDSHIKAKKEEEYECEEEDIFRIKTLFKKFKDRSA